MKYPSYIKYEAGKGPGEKHVYGIGRVLYRQAPFQTGSGVACILIVEFPKKMHIGGMLSRQCTFRWPSDHAKEATEAEYALHAVLES